MGEFVVEIPVGVRPGERFVASVGNGRKVTVRTSFFVLSFLKNDRRLTINRYDVRMGLWLVNLSI